MRSTDPDLRHFPTLSLTQVDFIPEPANATFVYLIHCWVIFITGISRCTVHHPEGELILITLKSLSIKMYSNEMDYYLFTNILKW